MFPMIQLLLGTLAFSLSHDSTLVGHISFQPDSHPDSDPLGAISRHRQGRSLVSPGNPMDDRHHRANTHDQHLATGYRCRPVELSPSRQLRNPHPAAHSSGAGGAGRVLSQSVAGSGDRRYP